MRHALAVADLSCDRSPADVQSDLTARRAGHWPDNWSSSSGATLKAGTRRQRSRRCDRRLQGGRAGHRRQAVAAERLEGGACQPAHPQCDARRARRLGADRFVDFDRKAAAGEKPETLERAEFVDEPAGRYFRYLKAIPVQPMCLACHGRPTTSRRREGETRGGLSERSRDRLCAGPDPWRGHGEETPELKETAMAFRQLFDPESSTYTYILADAERREAVIVDPVRAHIERDLGVLGEMAMKLVWIVETHVHADHVTGAKALKARTGARTAVSTHCGASGFDRLIDEGELIVFGGRSRSRHRHARPHARAARCFLWRDRLLTGDTLLIGGCGRTDFQRGSAEALYDSITGQAVHAARTTRWSTPATTITAAACPPSAKREPPIRAWPA